MRLSLQIVSTAMLGLLAAPATAADCPARPDGLNITRSVLALLATDYCKDLPYSKAEVEARLAAFACNAKGRKAVETTKALYGSKMKPMFEGPTRDGMCLQARLVKLN